MAAGRVMRVAVGVPTAVTGVRVRRRVLNLKLQLHASGAQASPQPRLIIGRKLLLF